MQIKHLEIGLFTLFGLRAIVELYKRLSKLNQTHLGWENVSNRDMRLCIRH